MNVAPLEPAVEAFLQELFRDDDLGAVVRTHIRLENLLIQLIEALAPKPENLKRLSLDFDGLVTLALLLGMDPTIAPALRAMGSLRNKFSHNLSTLLNDDSVNALYQLLSPSRKNGVQVSFTAIQNNRDPARRVGSFNAWQSKDRFKLIAVAIWVGLEADLADARSKRIA
jgi:hypothetical protein